jgi:hypothetical protein
VIQLFFFFFWKFYDFRKGALLGVPFAAIVLVVMAVSLLQEEGFVRVFVWASLGGLAAMLPQLLVDRFFYGRWVCAVCNIVAYNAIDNDSTL